MSKVWLVAYHQFREETSKRSFLLILFMMPLFLTFIIVFGYLVSLAESEKLTVGYVNLASDLALPLLNTEEDNVTFILYNSQEAAKSGMEDGQIDSYYVIGPDYKETRKAELFYDEEPPSKAMRQFEEAVRMSLVADQAPDVAHRMLEGATVTVKATEYGREYVGGGPSFGLFIPILAAAIFAFLIMTTSGYMTSVLAGEKSNKTIEIIVTSISVGRMMAGKVVGALGIAFMQLLIWVIFLVGAFLVGKNILEVSWLQEVVVGWRDVMAVIIVALPAYLFMASLMSLIGSMLADPTEAEQVGPMSMILIFLPIYLIVVLFNNPNGTVALLLTFFPPTSLVTIALRSLLIVVPAWQVAFSALISLAGGLFLVWLAGRAFRISMLRYGKRLNLRELFERTGVEERTA
ncbi:MAG: ABC transporter permease [Anaerolineae bacterium]|nr:MAG: ABC transporter permease [Anaerolineae bacterium]